MLPLITLAVLVTTALLTAIAVESRLDSPELLTEDGAPSASEGQTAAPHRASTRRTPTLLHQWRSVRGPAERDREPHRRAA